MPSHKTCYLPRKPCYKQGFHNTTDTGENKKISNPEINPIDQKFNKIHSKISTLISKELDETDRSRQDIFEKFEKIDAKINSMLDFQNNVVAMRETLSSAYNTLEELYQKIQKIEVMNELNSIKWKKTNLKPGLTEEEAEQELFSSEIAPVSSILHRSQT